MTPTPDHLLAKLRHFKARCYADPALVEVLEAVLRYAERGTLDAALSRLRSGGRPVKPKPQAAEPCARCPPGTISGKRFGIDGKLCQKHYNILAYQHEKRSGRWTIGPDGLAKRKRKAS